MFLHQQLLLYLSSASDCAIEPVCPQIFSVHAEVWPVCPGPQGDAHWLPLHDTFKGEELAEEVHPPREEPQSLLHQLAQLRHLLHQRQAQPSRTGKTHSVLLALC